MVLQREVSVQRRVGSAGAWLLLPRSAVFMAHGGAGECYSMGDELNLRKWGRNNNDFQATKSVSVPAPSYSAPVLCLRVP